MAYVLSRWISTCAVMRFSTDRYTLLADNSDALLDDVERWRCRLPRRLRLCRCCCLDDDDDDDDDDVEGKFIWYSTMI